jgi:Protein of unknown function (DUF4435)
LRELLNEYTLANEIRMARSQLKGVFLLVEGETDHLVYKHSTDKSVHFRIAGNRHKALRAHEILMRDSFLGVVTIVDADFFRVETTGKKVRQPMQRTLRAAQKASAQKRVQTKRRKYLPVKSLCFTDEHDLEMMMVHSPALDRVLDELSSKKKLTDFEATQKTKLRKRLLDAAAPLGYLLLVSLRAALNLDFKDLNFSKFIDEKTLLVNEKELLTAIKNHSGRHDLNSDALQTKLNALRKAARDLWQVCCGHHVLEILSFALRKTIGTYNKGEATREVLERSLRLAFERAYFKETRLYRTLLRWQSTHPPFVLISL